MPGQATASDGEIRRVERSRNNIKLRKKGLRRPKKPWSYQVKVRQNEDASRAGGDIVKYIPPVAPTTTEPSLEKRILLLDLIIRRNKNQHRNQLFFKHLTLLKSSLTKLLRISTQLLATSQSARSQATSNQVRRNFEIEADLRSQREVVERHVREVLVPQCYVSFTALVGDSQFANLGIVLVALLSEIACGENGVGAVSEVPNDKKSVYNDINKNNGGELGTRVDWSESLFGTSTRMTGEDQGEVIERIYDRDTLLDKVDVASETDGDAGDPSVDTAQIGELLVASVVPENVEQVHLDTLSEVQGTVEPGPQQQSSEIRQKSERSLVRGSGKSKKSKKSKNSIDDLFSGLL